MNVNPFVPGHYAEARFCCTGATVTGGRTGVLWKSLDKFWALPLGLRVCPQGTTGERGSFGGCAWRYSPEPNLHPLILSGAEEFSEILRRAHFFHPGLVHIRVVEALPDFERRWADDRDGLPCDFADPPVLTEVADEATTHRDS